MAARGATAGTIGTAAVAGAARARRRGAAIMPVAPLVRFGAMAVALLLGIVGFGEAYADAGIATGLTQNALSAVRLVVGNFPQALEGRSLPLTLNIARWALPLLTFWTTIALAWAQVRNGVRLYFIRLRGEHLVIAGDPGEDGGLAAEAARGELGGGRRVLLWPRDRRATWVTDALDHGAAEVEQDEVAETAGKLALDKARAVLLLGKDAATNIALASTITARTASVRAAGDPLDVILRIDDLDLRRSVEQRFEHGDRKTARVRLSSLPDIVSRQLSLARPIDAFIREGVAGRLVLVIGFTAPVERFLLRTLAGGHYRDGGKPGFFVYDSDAKGIEESFRARHPAADSLSPVTFVEARPDPARAAALVDGFVAGHGEPVAILIDQPDDDRALAIALAIDARYRALDLPAPPIHVQMDGAYDLRLGAGILPFGGLAALADPDLLLQDRHDALARSIHEFYLEGRFAEGERIGIRASMQEWENLPESFRDDNRLVADCYQLKLRDIGARLADGGGATFTLSSDELEEMSRAEHDRWMAAKLVQGWVYGPKRDDARRIHPDIIPYDDLSEPIKDLDREQVRIMARLLAASGRRALRTLTIAILPGATGALPDADALLSALAAHHPDRVPLFLGDIADAPTRTLLLALHQRGARIQVVLTAHMQAIIDALPADEQPGTIALFREADMVHACRTGTDMTDYLSRRSDLLVTGEMVGDRRRTILAAADGSIAKAPWIS
ncbi:MAG: RyR domain-containing protein [Sphingobium sp.]